MTETIPEWLKRLALARGDAPALTDIQGRSITWRDLPGRADNTAAQFCHFGASAGDTIALALLDGPDALILALAATSFCAVLPLSTRDPETAVGRNLDAAGPVFMVIDEAGAPEAEAAARARGLPILRAIASVDGGPTELVSIGTATLPASTPPQASALDDVAILIPTGGTTGPPQIVGISHRSLWLNSDHCADWVGALAQDRVLCVMPMAHLHFFIRSTVPALLRGAEVIVTPGFDPLQMPEWLDRFEPDWFTAAPGIYRGLLQRSRDTGWTPVGRTPRLVVTGSDAIDHDTVAATEALLGTQMMQFYGMSETAPLIAISPGRMSDTPDGVSVRITEHWQVACRDDSGEPVPYGTEGEIVVRGGLVNPVRGVPMETRLRDGWFYTGDMGVLDGKGWLRVTGRVDSRINRGGEKVSPGAIEAVLSRHPEVRQAIAFAVAHPVHGAVPAVAIVPHSPEFADASSIRREAAGELPAFAVPEHIVFTSEIPVSDTGKIRRGDLAAHFGLNEKTEPAIAERNSSTKNPADTLDPSTRLIVHVFRDLFSDRTIGPEDDFFELGGNSISALELILMIEEATGRNVNIHDLLEAPTPAGLGAAVDLRGWQPDSATTMLPVQTEGSGRPIFGITGLWGYPLAFRRMALALKPLERPFYAMETPEADTVEAMAEICLADIRAQQPQGPVTLIGYSFGALLVLEMAAQLARSGSEADHVVLLDPALFREKATFRSYLRAARNELRAAINRLRSLGAEEVLPDRDRILRNIRARDAYVRHPVDVEAILVATQDRAEIPGYLDDWSALLRDNSVVDVLDVGHVMLDEPHVAPVSEVVLRRLQDAATRSGR